MSEKKHTLEAEKAAAALWDDEQRFGPHSNKANYITKATTIIDRETAAPEQQAKIEELWNDRETLLKGNEQIHEASLCMKSKIDRFEAEGKRLSIRCGDLWDWAKKLEAEKAELVDTLKELTDLMQDVIDGTYIPDSLTLQPARAAIAAADSK